MGLGLGHRYWVRMVLHHCGDLNSCLEFMKANKPKNDTQWFELRPLVNIKQGQQITCNEYQCDLVEDAK